MVSVLYSGVKSLGLSPCRGHCVVFLGIKHFNLTVPLSTQVYKWVLATFNAGG